MVLIVQAMMTVRTNKTMMVRKMANKLKRAMYNQIQLQKNMNMDLKRTNMEMKRASQETLVISMAVKIS